MTKPLPRRRRGPGRRPARVLVTVRLHPTTLETLRATGRGWQTRAAAVLDRYASRIGRRS